MLKILRNRKTAKKIWLALAVIIIPAFALWGFGAAFRSREETRSLNKIPGLKVSQEEYHDSLIAINTLGIMQFGQNFDSVKKYMNLESQAWERLILLKEAKRRKIKISDAEVIQAIEKMPYFQTKDVFDNRIYSQILQYTFRLKPRQFEEQMRQNLILSKLYANITEGISIDDKTLREEYEKANQEIVVYYIASLTSDFAKNIVPTETELKAYFDKNKLFFKQPPSFNVEYLIIDSSGIAKEISEMLNKNATFEEITKKLSLTPKETGLFFQGSTIPGLEELKDGPILISRLKEGEHTGLIQMGYSYCLLRLKNKKEASIPELNEVKQKVEQDFINTEALKRAEEKINQCQDALKSREFENAAKECGLTVKETPPFTANATIEGIGPTENFWIIAKSLKKDQSSQILILNSGFYIIKVKSIADLDEKKYEKEKGDLHDNLLAQKKMNKIREFTETLIKKMQ